MMFEPPLNRLKNKDFRIESITRENGCDRVKHYDGTISYFKDGVLHRDNGPAVIYSNGDKSFYKNGLLHNLNGPAISFNRSFIENIFITVSDFILFWAPIYHYDIEGKKYTWWQYKKAVKSYKIKMLLQ